MFIVKIKNKYVQRTWLTDNFGEATRFDDLDQAKKRAMSCGGKVCIIEIKEVE